MDKKRVLIVAHCFPPASAAGVYRAIRFVKYLPEMGWQPTVLTVQPSESSLHGHDEGLLRQIPRGVDIVRIKDWRPYDRLTRIFERSGPRGRSNTNNTNRAGDVRGHDSGGANNGASKQPPSRVAPLSVLKDLANFMLATPDRSAAWIIPSLATGRRLVRHVDPHVILVTAPPHSSLLMGSLLSRMTGVPLAADFRDPWNRTPWREKHQSRLRGNLELRMERFCVKSAKTVILNTAQLRDDFVDVYDRDDEGKFVAIPNGFDPDLLEQVASMHHSPDASTPNHQHPIVCHPGTLYGGRDIRPVVDAIGQLKREGISVQLHQIGGVHNLDLPGYARGRGVEDRIHVIGRRSHCATLRHMSQSDVLMAIQYNAPLQVPGKLYEMLMFKKPIVVVDENGATTELVERYNLGAAASPNDPRSIARAINQAIAKGAHVSSNPGWERAIHDFNGRNQTELLAQTLERTLRASESNR